MEARIVGFVPSRLFMTVLRVLALVMVLMVAGFYLASGAHADDDVVANSFNAVQIVSILIGTVLPLVVGLVTKASTSATTKALLLLGLSTLSAFGTEFINNSDSFNWQGALLTAIVTFITGVGMQFGLYAQTVTPTLQNTLVKDSTPG